MSDVKSRCLTTLSGRLIYPPRLFGGHLSYTAFVKRYTLAGILVRTLVKDDDSQFLRWYLYNDSDFILASGMYIAYIELPDLRKQKILKIAIILPIITPDHW